MVNPINPYKMLFQENANIVSIPKNIKRVKNGKIRMECILQTVDDINNNHRRYPRSVVEEGIQTVSPTVTKGMLFGELDHPIDTNNLTRQMVVLYEKAAIKFLEFGWNGNKLTGVVETLPVANGEIIRNIALDGTPIGFSFRGMGDVEETHINGQKVLEVKSPLHVVTWDAVTNPSHSIATSIKITQQEHTNLINHSQQMIHESCGLIEDNENGLICTKEGICYLPNDFDRLVNQKVVKLIDRFYNL